LNPLEDENRVFVDLKFGPKWTYISTVRTFVENFMAISLADKKKAGLIAMSVNELIENAIKYSDKEDIQIKFQIISNEKKIYVKVSNHATTEEENNLKKILDEINSLPPLEAYLNRMKSSLDSLNEKSAIGLARVRYESRAEINHTYNDDGFVDVHAAIPIDNDEVCNDCI
jgi:hypothetical protein